MRKGIYFIILGVIVSTGAGAQGGPVLLTSIDVRGGLGGTFNLVDQRVAFVLNLWPDFSPDNDERQGLGDRTFWANGSSGSVDFTAQNDPNFANFANLATNGVNNFYTFYILLPMGGGAGGGAPESNWFCPVFPCEGHSPDFAGYQLDLVRLTVHTVQINVAETAPGEFVTTANGDVNYQFYGTPVPDAPVVILTLITLMYFVVMMPKRAGNRFVKLFCHAFVVTVAVGSHSLARADTRHGDDTPVSLWRTGSACPSVCPGIEARTAADINVLDLTPATGNVTIFVTPFADFSDNSDGGNGYGYYELYIGGTFINSSVTGVVSGAPSDGQFRKTDGSRPTFCCYHEGNSATVVVTDSFFNARLGIAGAPANALHVQVRIPTGSNVPCAAVANGCANMDDGIQRATVTWTPRPCDPPDCDDSNPCTTDTCVASVCHHTNVTNGTSCPDDGIMCNGVETCQDGECVSTPVHDCNSNGNEDYCDIYVDHASADCNTNNIPDDRESGVLISRIDAAPTPDGSLWRQGKNIIRFTFACDVTAPSSTQLLIRPLADDGGYGSSMSSGFAFTVENDAGGNSRILKIKENGTTLFHRIWYGIQNLGGVGGWGGVEAFEVDYLLQMGDANADKVVTSTDVSLVNAHTGPQPDDSRYDIGGNGFTTSIDVSIANAYYGSGPVFKPSGH